MGVRTCQNFWVIFVKIATKWRLGNYPRHFRTLKTPSIGHFRLRPESWMVLNLKLHKTNINVVENYKSGKFYFNLKMHTIRKPSHKQAAEWYCCLVCTNDWTVVRFFIFCHIIHKCSQSYPRLITSTSSISSFHDICPWLHLQISKT